MKIVYDENQETYTITLENLTMTHCISAGNVIEARDIFVNIMISRFDDAVNKQLKKIVLRGN